MNPLQAVFACLTGRSDDSPRFHSEKSPIYVNTPEPRTAEDIAHEVVETIRTASHPGPELQRALDNIVHEYGWTENIVKAILAGIEDIIRKVASVAKAMKEAIIKAEKAAVGFAKEHPVYFTLIALGVIAVLLAPWVLEVLGFSELGPIEGSWAALWQSTHRGYVPKGSLFSYFQRLGMKWGKRVVEI